MGSHPEKRSFEDARMELLPRWTPCESHLDALENGPPTQWVVGRGVHGGDRDETVLLCYQRQVV
jgi:hypothetical protein